MLRRISILFALLVTACTNAPKSAEAIPARIVNAVETQTPVPTKLPTATAKTCQLNGLNVVFIVDGNLYFRSDCEPERQLTSDGGAYLPKISDDGKVVVYQREKSLWAINSDGSNLRKLADISIVQWEYFSDWYEFQPKSHVVYFVLSASYFEPTNKLYRVDTDTLETNIVLENNIGHFIFSLDGSKIALVQNNQINVINAHGTNFIKALEYLGIEYLPLIEWGDPAPTWYIPQIVWLNDSSDFRVFIPSSDPFQDEPENSQFLNVATDGTGVKLLGEPHIAPLGIDDPLISPDGNKIAYLTFEKNVLKINVAGTPMNTVIGVSSRDAYTVEIWAWSPDSSNLIYWTDPNQVYITGIMGHSTLLIENIEAYSFKWVANDKFLYLRSDELWLGTIDNPNLQVITTGISTDTIGALIYDFAY